MSDALESLRNQINGKAEQDRQNGRERAENIEKRLKTRINDFQGDVEFELSGRD